ncbi:MAG: tetratricopeptide repeat protein [Gammaproteobacteria bacterium]
MLRLAGASLAALAVGTIIGFLFSSYGEEQASVGKIRDWLVGGITGIAIAEAMERGQMVKTILDKFVPRPQGPEDFGLVTSMVIVYSALGFFLMFFNRELILNLWLAESRARRSKLEEAARAASAKLAEVSAEQPVTDPVTVSTEKGKGLGKDPDVREFIHLAEKALQKGAQLRSDESRKLGIAYYYDGQYDKAIPYLQQAHSLAPGDADIALKLATAFGEMGRQREAVSHLEELGKSPNAPAVVFKLLGYYLLWAPEWGEPKRLDDAVEHSRKYLSLQPDDGGAAFNQACGYSQLYGLTNDREMRKNALASLLRAISLHPVWKERARELTGDDADFASLRNDDEFKVITKK